MSCVPLLIFISKADYKVVERTFGTFVHLSRMISLFDKDQQIVTADSEFFHQPVPADRTKDFVSNFRESM